ncbi:hypothetical protein [Microbacterium sp. NPDC056052]|uniref:hypothetical protein n=1 Tax=Microbacterium sp. NPDC056052 TaxID=3345695 RepID=UPI0035D58664
MSETKNVQRRTVLKGAAWSVPVVAAAAATPFAAASTINGFSVDGNCGLLGALGAGFTVTAGSSPIPAGTQITIHSTALVSLNLISLSGQGLAQVSLLGPNDAVITLTSPIPAGGTMTIQWLLSVSVLTNTTATLTLPAGDTAGPGTKSVGTLQQTLILCSAG